MNENTMEDNKASEAPTPCTAGCGFYGNKIYNNMCSKCFKEQDERNKHEDLVDSNILKMEKQPILNNNNNNNNNRTEEEPSIPSVIQKEEEEKVITNKEPEEEEKEPTKAIQKNKGRCFSCRVKIPLAKQLTNKCRCEYVFCDTHRYPDKHDCNFDHAQNDKDILLKNNPKLHDKPRGGNSFNRLDSI